ncbi:hypothetical protein I4U23_019958 [Adineta vaga]|nr:hypothetical protein I4U23_019958 [Adineta vaga]
MDHESDWVFVEDEDGILDELEVISVDENTDENVKMNDKPSYATKLLKNINETSQQQQTSMLTVGQKKIKSANKNADEEKVMGSCLEPKPGSQYRNPRDKAGKNKFHNVRDRSTSPQRHRGNSLRVKCSYCTPKLSTRLERTRNVRQQCSKVNWKDYDY